MITSEKSHQFLSEYIQFFFLSKTDLKLMKHTFSSEKIRNSGNHMHDYAQTHNHVQFDQTLYTGI